MHMNIDKSKKKRIKRRKIGEIVFSSKQHCSACYAAFKPRTHRKPDFAQRRILLGVFNHMALHESPQGVTAADPNGTAI